ncbi:MAG: permease-like cell division protein FtsX [Bacillota bacterium]|nr:permease-like cell division protein FtsX [Bacillota bacterium]
MLFIKCLPRLLKNANKDIRRNMSLTISSVISICLALLIAAFMIVVASNVGQFAHSIEDEFLIQVSINPTINEQSRITLQKEIEKISDVDGVTFSTKEEEIDKLINSNGEIFSSYQGENNPLYDVFVVRLKSSENMVDITKKIKKMKGVSDATFGGSMVQKLSLLFTSIRTGGAVFVGILVLLSIMLIRNTVKSSIQIRKDEIAIMRQVGAYNWYISFPFTIEGMIIGMYGSILPIALFAVGYTSLYKALNGFFMSELLPLLPPIPFILQVSLLLMVTGMFVGGIGSYLAARKYLRWAR